MFTNFEIDFKIEKNSKLFLGKKRNNENNKSTRSNSIEKTQCEWKNCGKRNTPLMEEENKTIFSDIGIRKIGLRRLSHSYIKGPNKNVNIFLIFSQL
jgi:hypothetical protein